MPVSLKQMRYAVAIARSRSFRPSGGACSVSQPALSQQILALEEMCGTPLFDRLRSGVRLTPFGRGFVDLAQAAIESAEALDAFALGHGGRPDRRLHLGLIPTVAPYLLPEIFPALTDNFADLSFTISENRTDALIAGLVDGSLDIALIGTEPPDSGPKLVSRILFHDPFVLATSRDETTAEPVSLASLAPERILLLDEGHCFRDQTIAACRLESDPAVRTFAATSLSTIVEFVANGQGVTLLPPDRGPQGRGRPAHRHPLHRLPRCGSHAVAGMAESHALRTDLRKHRRSHTAGAPADFRCTARSVAGNWPRAATRFWTGRRTREARALPPRALERRGHAAAARGLRAPDARHGHSLLRAPERIEVAQRRIVPSEMGAGGHPRPVGGAVVLVEGQRALGPVQRLFEAALHHPQPRQAAHDMALAGIGGGELQCTAIGRLGDLDAAPMHAGGAGVDVPQEAVGVHRHGTLGDGISQVLLAGAEQPEAEHRQGRRIVGAQRQPPPRQGLRPF